MMVEQLTPVVRVEVVHGEQGAGCAFDGGEGCSQLVGDGVENQGAEAFAFLVGLTARDLFEGLGAVEGDGASPPMACSVSVESCRPVSLSRPRGRTPARSGTGFHLSAGEGLGCGEAEGELTEVRNFSFVDEGFSGLVEPVAVEEVEEELCARDGRMISRGMMLTSSATFSVCSSSRLRVKRTSSSRCAGAGLFGFVAGASATGGCRRRWWRERRRGRASSAGRRW